MIGRLKELLGCRVFRNCDPNRQEVEFEILPKIQKGALEAERLLPGRWGSLNRQIFGKLCQAFVTE